MNSLLIVGSVAFDQIETPFGKTDKIIGGAGTYISLASSLFNIKRNLVSVVGYDFPENFLQILKNKSININGIKILKEDKTFFWAGRYLKNMNHRQTIKTELNALAKFSPVLPQEYKSPDIVMLGNLSPLIQQQVIKQLENKPKLVVLDTMNFWMETKLDELHKTLKLVDVITINDEEARQLSGEYHLLKAARKIIASGPKFVIIKKGEHGALLFSKDKMFFAPALPLENVTDPTGAGDSFAGGFCGYLTQTNDFSFENIKNAVVVGSAIASFNVEKFGTDRLVYLTNSELKSRIEIFKNLVDFNLQIEKL